MKIKEDIDYNMHIWKSENCTKGAGDFMLRSKRKISVAGFSGC